MRGKQSEKRKFFRGERGGGGLGGVDFWGAAESGHIIGRDIKEKKMHNFRGLEGRNVTRGGVREAGGWREGKYESSAPGTSGGGKNRGL